MRSPSRYNFRIRVGGGGGGVHSAPPISRNFLNFKQFLGKFGKIVCWRPSPGQLAPPSTENPGSALGTFIVKLFLKPNQTRIHFRRVCVRGGGGGGGGISVTETYTAPWDRMTHHCENINLSNGYQNFPSQVRYSNLLD